MKQSGVKVRSIARLGMLLALALLLSYLENLLPVLPGAVPGVKLGLSNIVTMYCMFFLNRRSAALVAVLKSGFVLLTRGAVAGLMSLCGGMSAVLVMILLIFMFKNRISYLILSVFGAVFHNIGQFAAAALILSNTFVFFYLPVLLVAGVVMGIATSALLRVTAPALSRVGNAVGRIDKDKL